MSRRHYSKKKKMQILEEAKIEKPSDVAAKYGFHVQTIYSWRMQFKKREESSKNDNAIKSNKLQEIEAERDFG
jgi:transposase-like protein